MRLFCLPADVPRFVDLGFIEGEHHPKFGVEMTDEEANYAHSSDMPIDLVYDGYHEEGGDYSAMAYTCDGKRFLEIEQGKSGGFVIQTDKAGRIKPADIRQVRAFVLHRARVEKLIAAAMNKHMRTARLCVMRCEDSAWLVAFNKRKKPIFKQAPGEALVLTGAADFGGVTVELVPEHIAKERLGVGEFWPSEKRVLNHYECSCGTTWQMHWSCGCDDKCPKCSKASSPTLTEDAEKRA